MAMRPVESNWYRDFLHNLTNTKNRFDTAISQSTSGKRLNKLSDDPADMAYVLTLRGKIEQIDQFDKNIHSASGFLSTAETALSQTQNLLYSVVSLAEQGASETIDSEGRQRIAERIGAIREEMINFANSEFQGRYVFAGTETDTKPFDVDGGGVFGYQGNSDTINIQADFSIQVATNIPGDEVFAGPTIDIFQELDDMVTNLNNDDALAVGAQLGNFNEVIGQVSEAIGIIGGRTAHLNQIQGMLKSFRTSLQSKMSSLEDADMAEAISNLAREEVGLQATLQSGSRINRVSLMNYLG